MIPNSFDYSGAPVSEVVGVGTPTVAVTCAPSTVPYPEAATCTAAVSGGASGTVTFTANGQTLGSRSVSNGVASISSAWSTPVGTYSVVASYGGDAYDKGNREAIGGHDTYSPYSYVDDS